jgi:hypothetical protein
MFCCSFFIIPFTCPTLTPSQDEVCASTSEPSAVPSLRPSFVPDCGNRNVLDFEYLGPLSQTCDQITASQLVETCDEIAPFNTNNLPTEVGIRLQFSSTGPLVSRVQNVKFNGIDAYRIEVPKGTTRIDVTWPVTFNASIGFQSFSIQINENDLSLVEEGSLGPFKFVSHHPKEEAEMYC